MMSDLKTSIKQKQQIEERYFDTLANQKYIKRYNYTAISCPYDVKMLSGETYIIGEIKVRKDRDIDFFLKFGAYLEFIKVNGIEYEQQRIQQINKIDTEKYYFNFCSDGVLIYKLEQPHHYNFTWKYLPANNFTPEVKIWKLVHNLMNPVEIIRYQTQK